MATTATSSSSTGRLCVCYPCALRMSTIPLPAVCGQRAASTFHKVVLTAPPTPAEVDQLQQQQAQQTGAAPLPFAVVTSHHPIFNIIYENTAAYAAYVAREAKAHAKANASVPITPIGSDGRHADMSATQQVELTADLGRAAAVMTMGSEGGAEGTSSDPSIAHPTCCACRGLYQHLDGYYVPRAAEEVRRSPYLQATELSVNVAVPRGFAYVWLAAAAEYLRGAVAVHMAKERLLKEAAAAAEGGEGPSSATLPPAVAQRLPAFPEDYSNFKDMFTPDVRARMMARLNIADPTEAPAAEKESADKRPREEESAEETAGGPSPPTTATTAAAPHRPRCSQAFGYCHTGTGGIIVEMNAQCALADELTGDNIAADGSNGGTYGVNAAGYAVPLTRGQQHEGRRSRAAAVLPKEWCTNKGAASGEPLQLFIIDDFVLPYMRETDDGFFKGRPSTLPSDLGLGAPSAAAAADGTTAQEAKGVSAHIAAAAAASASSDAPQWTCLADRAQWAPAVLANPSAFAADASSSGVHESRHAFAAPLAPFQCTVRHASVFIIGRYHKYIRGMSQSPWFGDGVRIGSFPLSLQEYIANPLLPLFFPYGIPQPVPPPGTPAAKAAAAAAIYAQQLKKQQQKEEAAAGGGKADATDNAEPAVVAATAEEAEADAEAITKGLTVKTSLGSATHTVDPNLVALFHVLGYGNYKFHTAGREDVDVRMLGTGRPFVLEILSPHAATIDFAAAERAVSEFYGGAAFATIEGLAYTSAEITVAMAKHSSEKKKTYRAVVYSSRPILSDADPLLVAANTTVKDLVVQQDTPLRVLHRRSLLSRPKTIHSLTLRRINNNWLVADLETQAGTYIKEFVHGDMGRTVPSLGTLLDSRMDIIQLDVLGMSSMAGEEGEGEGEGADAEE